MNTQTTTPHHRPRTLLWTGLFLCLVGCRGESDEAPLAAAEGDCARFEQESTRVNALIDELLDIPLQLPEDIHADPNATEELLRRFALHTRTIERAIDALHASHELECKAPYIDGDRFDEVFARVYQPHIAMIARQRAAALALADRLDKAVPPPSAAQQCRQIADELARGLRAQVSICESDFDPARCRQYTRAVATALETTQPAKIIAPPEGEGKETRRRAPSPPPRPSTEDVIDPSPTRAPDTAAAKTPPD